MTNQKFKFLEHTADVKFQAFGKSLEEAFVNASLALKEIMFGKIKIKSKIKKKIKINAKDNEGLLYQFLEQFLYLLDAENFIFDKVKVKISGFKLEAETAGDSASKYKFTNNVKAVTYNQMFVKQEEDKGKKRWVCQVVVDV